MYRDDFIDKYASVQVAISGRSIFLFFAVSNSNLELQTKLLERKKRQDANPNGMNLERNDS